MNDALCTCDHWFAQHDAGGPCQICPCAGFEQDAEEEAPVTRLRSAGAGIGHGEGCSCSVCSAPERLIQYVETFGAYNAAAAALEGLSQQDGYRGGRVHGGGLSEPYRLQVFFEDEPPASYEEGWLPDGCRRVQVPRSLWSRLGIQETTSAARAARAAVRIPEVADA